MGSPYFPRRPNPFSYTASLDDLYRVPPPSIARAAATMPETRIEDEPSPIGSLLKSGWDFAKGALNASSAAMGAALPYSPVATGIKGIADVLPPSLRARIPDPAVGYRQAMQQNFDAASDNGRRELSISEVLQAAPSPGDVWTETLAPGRPESVLGRVAKNAAKLPIDILADPINAATGGIKAAGLALKEGKLLAAGAKALGSAPAAAVYAPDIARGTYESGKEAVQALQEGRPGDAIEPGVQALLTGGLGLLMAKGVRGEIRDARAPRTLAEAVAREQPRPTPESEAGAGDVPVTDRPAPPAFPEEPLRLQEQPALDVWPFDPPPAFRPAPEAATPAPFEPDVTQPIPRVPLPPQAPDAALEALAAVPPPSARAAVPEPPMSPSEALRARLAREGAAVPPELPPLAPPEQAAALPPNTTETLPAIPPAAVAPEALAPQPIVPAPAAAAPEPRYAFRARDVGEQGVPTASHAQASMSEADVRRVAPSRTEAPQEVVRIPLDSLDPNDYEVVPRGEGQPPWVRFKRELPETALERVGPVDAIDVAAASKAEPAVTATVAQADTADLAQVAGLSLEQAKKGAEDVIADGMREFSPEAVAIKRAVIAGQVDVPATMTRRQASRGKELPKDERGQQVYPGEEALSPDEREALNGVVAARVRELELANKSQPTGRRPILGGPALNSVEGYQGTPSHKTGTALEGIPEGPKEIAAAIERDKGNALELRVREAILRNDEELGAHLDRLAAEGGAGDDSFPVEKYSVRPSPGQRALEGIADDVPAAAPPARRQPEQGALFRGGDMLQPTEARVTEGREADGPVFRQDQDARARQESAAQTELPTERYATAPRTPPAPDAAPLTRETVAKAFPTGKIGDHPDGGHLVTLPGDRQIRVDQVGNISYNPAAFKAGYGRRLKPGETLAGKWEPIERGGLIQLAKGAPVEPTLLHESFHAAMDLALNDAERAAVLKRYGTEEKAADAYGTWVPAKQTNSWFSKIYSFARNLVRSFSPTWESTFERVRSGKAFEGPGRAPKPAPAAGGAPPKEPPGPRPRPIGLEPEAAEAGARHGGKSKGKPPETLINLDRIAEPKDVREIEGRVQEALRERGLKERSYRSWDEARDKAVASGLTEDDVKRLLKEKGALTDVEIEAGRMLRETAFRDMRDKLDAMRRLQMEGKTQGTEYDEAVRAYQLSTARSAGIMLTTVRAGSEAGRALAIHRKMSKAMTPEEAARARRKLADPATPEAEKYAIRQSLEQATILTEQEQLLQRAFKQMPGTSPEFGARFLATPEGDHRALAALLRSEFHPKLRTKAYELWINGLLSGVPTHLANMTGNTLTQLLRIPEKAMAGALDAAKSKVTGSPRDRFVGEALADVKMLREGLVKAGRAFRASWADEFQLKGGSGRLEHQVGAIGGRTGSAIRTPGRLLAAADEAFKALAATREEGSLAYRKARAEGKTGKALANRIEEIRSSLESHPEILEGMEKAAEYQTFTKRLGEFGQRSVGLRDSSGPLKVIVPFMKTPINIAKYTLERTPLNFLRLLDRNTFKLFSKAADDEKLAEELAKPILGTLMGIGFGMMAEEGLLTGGGPTDTKKRQALEATGWQPYSVKVGDTYISFARLEPLSSIAGFAADMVETQDEDAKRDIAKKVVAAITQNLTNKTFLQGVENVFQAWSDPTRFAGQWFENLQGSAVPAIVARTAQALDPVVRETSASDGSAIAARLPGVSTLLEPKRRGTGEPVERKGSAVERFISPLPRSVEKGEEADLERAFVAANYVPSPPSRTVKIPKGIGGRGQKVELSEQEYDYLEATRERVTARLREVVKDPRFERMDPLQQGEYMRRLYETSQREAQARLWRTPPLRQRAAAVMRESGGRA
jgi:hypothetical protein